MPTKEKTLLIILYLSIDLVIYSRDFPGRGTDCLAGLSQPICFHRVWQESRDILGSESDMD
jgi:hypothetical protein